MQNVDHPPLPLFFNCSGMLSVWDSIRAQTDIFSKLSSDISLKNVQLYIKFWNFLYPTKSRISLLKVSVRSSELYTILNLLWVKSNSSSKSMFVQRLVKEYSDSHKETTNQQQRQKKLKRITEKSFTFTRPRSCLVRLLKTYLVVYFGNSSTHQTGVLDQQLANPTKENECAFLQVYAKS